MGPRMRRSVAGLVASTRRPLLPTMTALVTFTTMATLTTLMPLMPPTAVRAAPAGVVVVYNRADDGSAGSLRSVIDTVNADGGHWRIELLAGAPYVIDRLCGNGDLDDNHGGDVDILTGADVTFFATAGTQATIAVGCVGERVVDHLGAGIVRFEQIRLTGGNTAKGANGSQTGDLNADSSAGGGAIRSQATVQLVESVVEGNSTGNGGNGAPSLFAGPGGRGGSGGVGTAVQAETISAVRSVIRDNTAGNGGNGANGTGAGNSGGNGGSGGRATLAGELVSVHQTQIDGNTAGNGGNGGDGLGAGAPGGDGGFGGSGAGVAAARVEIHASTVSNNVTGSGGRGGKGNGGPGGDGGGAGSGAGSVSDGGEIVRSTIHGNSTGVVGVPGSGVPSGTSTWAGQGGGVLFSSGEDLNEIVFSTVTANSAPSGANLDVYNTHVRHSVIGEAEGASNCKNPVTIEGYSAVDDASCGQTDFMFAPLGLGPLGDNGGRTQTRLPLPGSPLAGLIPADVCATFGDVVDQRDELRPSGGCEPGSVELPPDGASKFMPLAPQRVFDTRTAGAASGVVAAGETRTVQFAGVAGVPVTGATAVAFNLTIADARGPGFVTAYEAGQQRPLASSLNTVRAGQVVPNMVIVPLGANGQIDFYAQAGGHLLADVMGYFVNTPVATDGRIVALPPARLFDTRVSGAAAGKVPAGGTLTVDVTGVGGVPESGVAAVVINVTGTDANAAGYVTVHPGTGPRPLASTLNLDGTGHTAANLAVVPVGSDGTITLFSQSGTHLLADVSGYVTDATAPRTSQGLLVPIRPSRLFDTRASGGAPEAGETIERGAVGGDIPESAAGVVINLTATEAVGPGFVTGYPLGVAQPLASTLNLTAAGETRPNAALLPVGDDGKIAYFSQSGAHLLADAFGYLVAGATTL